MRFIPLSLVCLAAIQSCALFGPRLPVERPANFSIRYGHDGGMLPVGWTLFLSEKESHYAHTNDGITNRIDFKTSPRELDKIYAVLRANSFPRIKVSNDFAHDKAGYSIAVRYGKESRRIGTSGTFIARSWRGEWRAIRKELDAIKNKAIAAQALRIRVRFHSSLADKKINVYFGQQGLTRVVGGPDLLKVDLLPGRRRMRVVLWKRKVRRYTSAEYRAATISARKFIQVMHATTYLVRRSGERLVITETRP